MEWLECLEDPEYSQLQISAALSREDVLDARLQIAQTIKDILAKHDDLTRVEKKSLSKLRRAAKVGASKYTQVPEAVKRFSNLVTSLDKLNAFLLRHDANEKLYAAKLLDSKIHQASILMKLAKNEIFAESILTTSPTFYRFLQHALTQSEPQYDPNLVRRIYFYLQRGAAKTHVSSKLGKVLFATFDRNSPDVVSLRERASARERNKVSFSYWAAHEIAKSLSRRPSIWQYLRPSISPSIKRSGYDVLNVLEKRSSPLSPCEIKFLDQVDGSLSLNDISRLLDWDMEETADAGFSLEKKGLIALSLFPPATIFDPLTWLRQTLSAFDTIPVIEIEKITKIEDLLQEYERSNSDKRLEIQAQLEERFSALSGVSSRRAHGKTYGDRLIFYEECASPLEVTFGDPFIRTLEEELSGALEVAFSYGKLWLKYYQQIATQVLSSFGGAESGIPFYEFVHRLQEMGQSNAFSEKPSWISSFEVKWENLIERKLRVSEDGVARLDQADVETLESDFDYKGGAHCTVDLFIATNSVEDLKSGRYKIIVGEIGENVMVWGSQFYFHPDRQGAEQRTACLLRDVAGYPRLAIILPERTHKGFVNQSFADSGNLFITAVAQSASRHGTDLPLKDLFVYLEDNSAVLRDLEGRRLQFFHHHDDLVHLWAFAAPRFILPQINMRKSPRVEVNGVCLQRAQVWLRREEFGRMLDDEVLLGVALRSFWRNEGLPKACFIHAASEPKPFYAHIDAPITVSLFQYLLRRDEQLKVVEMWPQPQDAWRRSEDGHRFVELRVLLTREGKGSDR